MVHPTTSTCKEDVAEHKTQGVNKTHIKHNRNNVKNDKTVWFKPFTIMPHQFKFALKASKEDILPKVCRSTNVNYLEDENEEQQEDIEKPTK